MKQTIRIVQCPVAVSFIAAAILFPFMWAVGVFLVRELIIALPDGAIKSIKWVPWYDTVLVCATIGLPVIPAYWVARTTYMNVRWKDVEYDGSSCRQCGYDLTGNISGVCPECGRNCDALGG